MKTQVELTQAVLALQTKVDAVWNQLYSMSILVEYMMDRLNSAADAADTLDIHAAKHLRLDLEEMQKFYLERTNQLQEDYQAALAKQLQGMPQQPQLNLGE